MQKGSMPGRTRMRRAARLFALLAPLGVIVPAGAAASEFSGAVTLTSEYISRGQAVSGGNPALQVALDYGHDSGFFGGLWASTIDVINPFSVRERELDFYLGYVIEPCLLEAHRGEGALRGLENLAAGALGLGRTVRGRGEAHRGVLGSLF